MKCRFDSCQGHYFTEAFLTRAAKRDFLRPAVFFLMRFVLAALSIALIGLNKESYSFFGVFVSDKFLDLFDNFIHGLFSALVEDMLPLRSSEGFFG
jgi:hypothetical protein